MKIGVTGASGFVGGYLLPALREAGHQVTALVRSPAGLDPNTVDEIVAIPTIDQDVDASALTAAMAGLDVVVHLAARVHVMDGSVDEHEFQRVNVAGSAKLFEAAEAAGVRRFVFMSTVKAAGERSRGNPMTAADAPGPEDAYGRSKRDAETRLASLAVSGECRLVILRPAFVYGWPRAGNFRPVISAILKGVPLPLAGIRNRRDMTYAGNLASAIATACSADGLGDTPYFIADGQPVSTPDLFRGVGNAFGRPARLFYAPAGLLQLLGTLTGRSAAVARLTEDFVVDTAPFNRDARWQPPYKMSDGLGAIARAWRETKRAGSD
mgnify:CR=1 FL=1